MVPLSRVLPLSVAIISLVCGCGPASSPQPPEPLPPIVFNVHTAVGRDAAVGTGGWSLVAPVCGGAVPEPPEAVETHLDRDRREVWRTALRSFEEARLECADLNGMRLGTPPAPESCAPDTSGFSMYQRTQLRMALQFHRNVLWHIGRLEMAYRGAVGALDNFVSLTGGASGSGTAIAAPLKSARSMLDGMRDRYPEPKGDWNPGELAGRFARSAMILKTISELRESISSWGWVVAKSDRWAYLAPYAEPCVAALDGWLDEYAGVVRALGTLASHLVTLDRDFAPPHAIVDYPCISRDIRSLRNASSSLAHMTAAYGGAVRAEISANSVAIGMPHGERSSADAAGFVSDLSSWGDSLALAIDAALSLFDDANDKFWLGLPELSNPIAYSPHPQTGRPDMRSRFLKLRRALDSYTSHLAPEPVSAEHLNRRRYKPYIFEVLDTLRSPSRIDDAERGLLAISEIEAHMVGIRDELLRLCRDGACRSFPEAELGGSPRTNPYVVSWRQAPASERTLGHSLIVIRLCQLHLARLAQRLAEIYAWFAETSNADLSWKKLRAWQRIWTLYAEPNGNYASFLRGTADLERAVYRMAVGPRSRQAGEWLGEVLGAQYDFFKLTLEFADLMDAHVRAPVSFDELMSAWEAIESQLQAVSDMTSALIDKYKETD